MVVRPTTLEYWCDILESEVVPPARAGPINGAVTTSTTEEGSGSDQSEEESKEDHLSQVNAEEEEELANLAGGITLNEASQAEQIIIHPPDEMTTTQLEPMYVLQVDPVQLPQDGVPEDLLPTWLFHLPPPSLDFLTPLLLNPPVPPPPWRTTRTIPSEWLPTSSRSTSPVFATTLAIPRPSFATSSPNTLPASPRASLTPWASTSQPNLLVRSSSNRHTSFSVTFLLDVSIRLGLGTGLLSICVKCLQYPVGNG
ncbi:hypothetical protein EDB83DRAFT_2534220 [Lactarius deliciosus]|nr:hypothetical protein EDB83DRAFT_2534220 [Lactarius deliciosus]